MYPVALDISPGPDGWLRSYDRFGVGTPSASCPTGYGCDAIGTVSECTVEDVAGVVTFTVRNPGDTSGVCPALKTYVSETDWHCEVPVTSVTGGGQYAGVGCEISLGDGDYSTPDAKAYCWYADGRVRMKYDVGRAGQTSSVSSEALTPGTFSIANEYDDATNQWVCGYKVGADFFQVGGAQTAIAFTAGVRGIFSSAYSASNAATIVVGPWEDTTTRDPYVDEGEPEPPPPGESDTPEYSSVTTYTNPSNAQLALVGVTLDGGRTTCTANNVTQFNACLAASSCKVTIQMGPGDFSHASDFSETTDCTATTPVIVKGAANFATTISSQLTLNGDWMIVTGINFRNQSTGENQVKIGNATAPRVIGNKFSDWRHPSGIGFSNGGRGCEIAYNEFSFATPNRLPTDSGWPWIEGEDAYPLRMGIRSASELNFHPRCHVHHNYFHDFPPKPGSTYGSGQSDAIEMCHDTTRQASHVLVSGWYIESNLIERHYGTSGIVDMKCGGVVVWRNTVLASPGGRIDQRSGTFSIFESNWQSGSGGSNIHSRGHKLIGNYQRGGSGIELIAGDPGITCDEAIDDGGKHSPACATTLAGNNVNGYTIGKDYGPQTVNVTGTVIEQCETAVLETGGGAGTTTVTLGLQSTTTNNCGSATSINFATPTKLTAGQVGPGALSSAPQAYRDARGLQTMLPVLLVPAGFGWRRRRRAVEARKAA